jgi:curved DNA-binding protein CbpA
LPDAILEITPTATSEQIKTAYKKAALKWHPDRVAHDSPERAKRTKRFQAINDAYYTLSETTRRKEYDEARSFHGAAGGATYDADDEDADEEIPRTSTNTGGFPWSWFTGKGAASASEADDFSRNQFQEPFEEMMNAAGLSEGADARPTGRFWSIVGTVSGGALGFIVGNFVGASVGAVAGNKLGGIRDKSGKSVYEVFQSLDQGDKAKVLSELAAKIFQGAIS